VLGDVRGAGGRVASGRDDAGVDGGCDAVDRGRRQVAPDRDAAQRDRRAGPDLPPVAQIDDAVQPVLGIGEARLVDDQARIDLARLDRRHDRVVAHLDPAHAGRRVEIEQQVRRRPAPGRGDGRVAQLQPLVAGHDQRPHAVPHRAARRQHPPVVGDPSEGVVGHLRDVQLAVLSQTVQPLDVLEPDGPRQVGRDDAVHQRVEDEGVVGAGREAET